MPGWINREDYVADNDAMSAARMISTLPVRPAVRPSASGVFSQEFNFTEIQLCALIDPAGMSIENSLAVEIS